MSVALESAPRSGEGKGSSARGGDALRRSADWAHRAPLLPALIFTIVVTQLPFVVTLIVSFMDWNAYYPDERGFAGLTNYKRVLTDVNMRDAILTTVLLTATVVLVSLFLGMVIALLLDRKFVGRGAVRAGHRQPSLHDLPNLLPGPRLWPGLRRRCHRGHRHRHHRHLRAADHVVAVP
jgi:hypothetical protein